MPRAVRFHEYGGPEVLALDEVELPAVGRSQVRIRVEAAGLNPADSKVRRGEFLPSLPKSLPSGIGFEAAGVVDAVGEDVTGFSPGDEVFGLVRLGGVADFAIAPATSIARKPAELDWPRAGGLASVGQTALDIVASQQVTPGMTALVSAAAGGVGSMVAQLAMLAGARVIGTASAGNVEYLEELGILPIAYGPGLAERLLETADDIDVVFDHAGEETVRAALALGVDAGRINTIAADAQALGVRGVGQQRADPAGLELLAHQVADGQLTLRIDSAHGLDDAQAAYRRLDSRHARGKVVIVPTLA
ncbi:NADP-dependent oxidoreductase [Ruicaihuangia caeni]|uniref:NADP-dependent oxidoreductase n=1 Tax=Ruicaihuangia caeni TaxID=3042517 RepID=A0AAW6T8Z7_9MICO|nr:NADP-dependent oxidoreductase [Klugiella sp. YN-L-19]MDI2099699.1 NADP-dependent oxidoreductase [Klugiella sp. YN-L-19]